MPLRRAFRQQKAGVLALRNYWQVLITLQTIGLQDNIRHL